MTKKKCCTWLPKPVIAILTLPISSKALDDSTSIRVIPTENKVSYFVQCGIVDVSFIIAL
jgi:hypothetical protein